MTNNPTLPDSALDEILDNTFFELIMDEKSFDGIPESTLQLAKAETLAEDKAYQRAKADLLALIQEQTRLARVDELERMHERSFYWKKRSKIYDGGIVAVFIDDYHDRLAELQPSHSKRGK